MFKRLLLIFSLFFASLSWAQQVPQAFNWQGVINDANGNPLVDTTIGIAFQINQGSPNGTTVYISERTLTTDATGFASTFIGDPTNASEFSNIDWSVANYLEVRVDINGGVNYSSLGASQLLSVPYAIAAGETINNTTLKDTDGDTKIQVEESADEDIIRFDVNGTEYMTLSNGNLGFENTGNSIFIGNGAGLNDNRNTNNNNIAIGENALETNISGINNTALGLATLNQATGNENTGIGTAALALNINGDNNVALGYSAGLLNTGSGNIFIGHRSGQNETGSDKLYIENSTSNTPLIYGEFDTDLVRINGDLEVTGSFEIPEQSSIADADGDTKIQVEENADEDIIRFDVNGTEYMTLSNGNLGFENTGNSIFIGNSAGLNDNRNTNNNNIAIGENALESNVSGINNTALGLATLNQATGNENTGIGAAALALNTNGNNNVALGYSAGLLNTGSGNIFIGHRAGQNETGSDKLYIENSTSNTPLIYGDFDTDLVRINGDLEVTGSFEIPEQSSIADADGDTKIQVEENADEDIIRFDVNGIEYMTLSNGNLGFENTGNSIFIGNSAGLNDNRNTNNNNIAIGENALESNVSGINNTALGLATLNQATGNENTGIGAAALALNTNGNNNVALGYSAGLLNTGSGNIFIGHRAGQNETGSDKLYIENSTSNTPLIYGEFDTNSVQVNGSLQIGESTPLQGIYKSAITRNVGRINGNRSRVVTFTIEGASLGDVVYVSPSKNLQSQIVIGQCWVSAENTVSVRFRNTSGGQKDPDGNGATYYISVIK